MTQQTLDAPTPGQAQQPAADGVVAPAHTWVEDVAGLLTGTFLASAGLALLKAGGVVTGGLAGLALLVDRVVPLGFGLLFLALSLPFVALAVTRKGWPFTLRTLAALVAVSGFSELHPLVVRLEEVHQAYAALGGNLAIGVGILIVFRHGASLGGFNIVALICQERRGWRAGYVQLVLDALVVASFGFVGDLRAVLVSVAGAVVLNLVLAMNHRPGRYTA